MTLAIISKEQESKKWPQFFVVFIATFMSFISGLHIGWPAPSLPKLLSDEFPFNVTNDEASNIAIMSNLGSFCGCQIGNFMLDYFGRKKTLLFSALPEFLAFFFIIMSYEVVELLYVARFLYGIGEGIVIIIIFVYIGEISEPAIRGILCSIAAFSLYFGVLFINIIGSFLTIKVTAMSLIALPVIFVILFWKMPESPYYLLIKNKEEEAIKVLKFLRSRVDVSDEVERLKSDVNRQMSETGTYRDIFAIDSNRKAFLVTLGGRFFQVTTGMYAFGLYIQLLMKEATGTLEPYIASSIILLIQLVMTVVSVFIVDRWGRKPLLLVSISGCCISLILQTIFFILKEHTSVDTSVIEWFPLVMMMLHIFLYSLGLGGVVSILTSEMFSASIKGKLICWVNGLYALIMLVSTKFYQAAADNFGLTVPFATFAVLTFIGVLFFYYLVPETKGKTLEEIQQELKGKGKKKYKNGIA